MGLFSPFLQKSHRINLCCPRSFSAASRFSRVIRASGTDVESDKKFENNQSNLNAELKDVQESTPKRKMSRTEEIAAKLGKSKESMKAQQEKVYEEARMSNMKKYGLALLSFAVALTAVLAEKFDPNTGSTLLRYLQSHSAPIEVVGNGTPTVVEFSAMWCENCKLMARSIFDLENEYLSRVNFVVLDADNPENQKAVDEYAVDGIPQLSLMDGNGNNLGNFVGLMPKTILADNLEAILNGKELPHSGFSAADFERQHSDT